MNDFIIIIISCENGQGVYILELAKPIINPRSACAARVTVVVLYGGPIGSSTATSIALPLPMEVEVKVRWKWKRDGSGSG